MRSKIRLLLRNRYSFLLIVILFCIFWIWWLPGPRAANDFSVISNDFLRLQFNSPFSWNERGAEGLGEYGAFILWSYPLNFIFGFLSFLNLLNFEIWERVLVILYIILGSFSIWRFLTSFSFSDKTKFLGSLFYLSATYPVLLIDGGQISIALAYAIFPLCYLLIYNSVSGSLSKKLKAGLLVTVLGIFDIRFVYILFLLLIFRMFFDLFFNIQAGFKKTIINWIYTGLVEGLTIILLNVFWLFLQIKTPLDADIFNSFTKLSGNFLNMGYAFLFLSPHWFKNTFGKISDLKPEFLFLTVLVFAAPILKRRDKHIAFWLCISIISIFLIKGASEPFPDVYLWMYANVPGFSLFRDSTKFFFLLGLSYSFLISVTIEELFKILAKYKKLSIIYFLFLISYFLFLIRPVFLNQMTGTFSTQPDEKDYGQIAQILQNDSSFGRVFWIPGTKPLSYLDQNHTIVEASRVFNKIPFVFGVHGGYEIFNFLREAIYTGEIFDIAGISYIAYPPIDTRRDNAGKEDFKYYFLFLNQLEHLPWINTQKPSPNNNIPLLKTKKHQDKFFITDKAWLIFGSTDILNESTKSANLSLSKNALIFADQKTGSGELLEGSKNLNIALNKKTLLDFQLSFVQSEEMIFPQDSLEFSPDTSGWWKHDGKDIIGWRDFLQSKYRIDSLDFDLGKGWAIGEGNSELRVKNLEIDRNKILFARVMESSRSGQISFYQDDNLIGAINTKSANNNVRWFKVDSLQSDSQLTIKTEGDINTVNALAVLSQNKWTEYQKNAERYLNRVSNYSSEETTEANPTVVYQQINPTKYIVSVKNVIQTKMLIFSESFNSGWKLDNQTSIKTYGFLNGFMIEDDGNYILEFEPQKYIFPGLLFSLTSLAVIVFLLLKLK